MNLYESDFIGVKGKKQASDDIIRRYGDFGWKLIENKDDKFYGDVTHMSFMRPHVIENKDELQLLQVRLEIAYNNMGKFAHKINARASVAAITSGLVFAALAACGIILFLLFGGLLPVIFGSLACAAGVIAGLAGGLLSVKFHRTDKDKYASLIKKEIEKTEELCIKARALRGDNE